jgi:hypothetical protein
MVRASAMVGGIASYDKHYAQRPGEHPGTYAGVCPAFMDLDWRPTILVDDPRYR